MAALESTVPSLDLAPLCDLHATPCSGFPLPFLARCGFFRSLLARHCNFSPSVPSSLSWRVSLSSPCCTSFFWLSSTCSFLRELVLLHRNVLRLLPLLFLAFCLTVRFLSGMPMLGEQAHDFLES